MDALAWLALAVVALAWSASDYLPDFGGDAAVYWLTANYWSPYATALPTASQVAAASTYPPLYPAVLALLGGGISIRYAHYLTAAILVVALWVVRTFYRRLGIPAFTASILTFLFALLPIVRWEALDLHSEPLYLALSCAALVLALDRDGRELSLARLSLLGVAVAGALLTRTVGIALLGAVAIHAFRLRSRAWFLPLALGAGAWIYEASSAHSTGSYLHLFAQHFAQSDEPLTLIWQSFLGGYLAGVIGPDTPHWLMTVTTALLPLFLIGMVWRAYCGFLDGYYALLYLVIILVWPFPAESTRLLMPIFPVILGQTAALLASCKLSFTQSLRTVPVPAMVLVLALITVPDTIRVAVRLATPVAPGGATFKRFRDWYDPDPRQATYMLGTYVAMHGILAEIPKYVPEGDCVFAIKPSIVNLFGQRQAYLPPLPDVPEDAFIGAVAEHNCHYFLLLNFASPTVPVNMYPYARVAAHLNILAVATNPLYPKEIAAALAEWHDSSQRD